MQLESKKEGEFGGGGGLAKHCKDGGRERRGRWGSMWEWMHLSGGQRRASRGSSVRMGEGREAGVNTGSCERLQSSSLHSNSDSSNGTVKDTK